LPNGLPGPTLVAPHYKTYLKDLTKRLKLESLSHTMKMCLFHGVAGSSFLYLNSRPCFPKSHWWPKAVQGATNWLEQSIKYPSLWQGLLWWDSFCRMISWYIQALQHSGGHICSSLQTHFSWTILMFPEMTARVSIVYFSHFQSSLRSLGTDRGHGAPLGSCLNLRQMIPKDRMPLCFTMSILSYYKVCKRPTHLEVWSQMCWDMMAFNEP
jgi:hypothetical protein